MRRCMRSMIHEKHCALGISPVTSYSGVKHGMAIALNCWGRRLENVWNNSELFYVLGCDCQSMESRT